MAKAKKKQQNDDMPQFLRRGSPEHAALVKKSEEMRAAGKGLLMVVAADRDSPVHALAAELGFKRHQYRVEWFRDPKWLEARMEEKAKRDAEDAEKRAKRDAEKARAKEERQLAGGGNRKKGERVARKRDDLPQGRIVWVGPNPKKEGSDAWERWETLRGYDKKTVEAYCLDKHNQTTLANAIAQGKVKIMGDAEIAAMSKEKVNAETSGASASAEAGTRQKKPKGAKAGGAAEPDGGSAGAARPKAGKPDGGVKKPKSGTTRRVPRRGVKK